MARRPLLERLGIRSTPAEPRTDGVPRSESGRGHDMLSRPRGGAVGFVVPDEIRADLQGQSGFKIYDEMFKGDPDVRRSLMMLGAPMIGATWEVEAFGGDHANEAAAEQAEFVEWCLFEAMRPKWPAHLMQAWRVLRYGNAPFEQVYRKDKWQPKPKPAPEPEPEQKPADTVPVGETTKLGEGLDEGKALHQALGPFPTDPSAQAAYFAKLASASRIVNAGGDWRTLFQAPDPKPDEKAAPGKGEPADASGAPPEPKMIQGKERDVLCIDQLHLKLPRTIWRYESIGERLYAIHQLVVGGEYMSGQDLAPEAMTNLGGPAIPGEIRIPAEDLLFYRLGAEGDNWEGESMLRPVVKPYRYKSTLELVEAIGHERYHVGMPVGYPPQGASDNAKRGLNDVLGKIRSNETGHIMMPGPKQNQDGEGWLIEILTPAAGEGGTSIRETIEGHRDGISAGLFAEFMRLGQGAAGSKGALSTAQSQQDPFYALIEAFIGVYIEDPVNEQLVSRLWELNFNEAERKEAGGPPKLSASKIDAMAADALATAITGLASGDTPVIFPDDKLEDAMRERLDLPPADPKARAERKAKKVEDEAHAKEIEKAGIAPKPGDAGEKVVETNEPLPFGGARKSVETQRLSQLREALSQEGPLELKLAQFAEYERLMTAAAGSPCVVQLGAAPHTGVMVALVPTGPTAEALTLQGSGAEAPERLHLTLAVLEQRSDELSDVQVQGLLSEVKDWAAKTGQLNGRVSGVGLFMQPDGPVTYLSIDIPALPKARQALVDRLDHADTPASKQHGYSPHMTVAFGDRLDDAQALVGTLVSFSP